MSSALMMYAKYTATTQWATLPGQASLISAGRTKIAEVVTEGGSYTAYWWGFYATDIGERVGQFGTMKAAQAAVDERTSRLVFAP